MLSAARTQRSPEANALLTSVSASLAFAEQQKSFVVQGARVDASSLALGGEVALSSAVNGGNGHCADGTKKPFLRCVL